MEQNSCRNNPRAFALYFLGPCERLIYLPITHHIPCSPRYIFRTYCPVMGTRAIDWSTQCLPKSRTRPSAGKMRRRAIPTSLLSLPACLRLRVLAIQLVDFPCPRFSCQSGAVVQSNIDFRGWVFVHRSLSFLTLLHLYTSHFASFRRLNVLLFHSTFNNSRQILFAITHKSYGFDISIGSFLGLVYLAWRL